MRDRGFPFSGDKPLTKLNLDPEGVTAGFVSDGGSYPAWTDDQKFAIANQCDAFADEFFGRNGQPDAQELDSLLRTLYDLVHGL